jgi:hypothetical protein
LPADTAANGATKIPMTMQARTEVLGAEDTALRYAVAHGN